MKNEYKEAQTKDKHEEQEEYRTLDPYPFCKKEGLKLHFDLWFGSFVMASEVEALIKRFKSDEHSKADDTTTKW